MTVEIVQSTELAHLYLEVSSIDPSPTNPRKHFDQQKLAELTESIVQHGVLQPILVRPRGDRYELVAGERRFRATREAGLDKIPAVVRELDDKQTLEVQVVENLQRADLDPLEEAAGYSTLIRDHGYTADELALKIGKSRSYVYSRTKLNDLCDAAKDALAAGHVSASVALLVARIPDEKLQKEAVEWIVGPRPGEDVMSFRDVARHIQSEYMLRLEHAGWKLDDAELVPSAGPCTTCPLRTGNQSELFADVKSSDLCTSPACFKSKGDAYWAKVQASALAAGRQILDAKKAKAAFSPYSSGAGAVKANGAPLNWGCGFVSIHGSCDHDPKRRSWVKVLGKSAPTVVVARNPYNDIVYELYPTLIAEKTLRDVKLPFAPPAPEAANTSTPGRASAPPQHSSDRHIILRLAAALAEIAQLPDGRCDETGFVARRALDPAGMGRIAVDPAVLACHAALDVIIAGATDARGMAGWAPLHNAITGLIGRGKSE